MQRSTVMEAHAKLLKRTGMETQADFWAAKAIAAKKKYETFCTFALKIDHKIAFGANLPLWLMAGEKR